MTTPEDGPEPGELHPVAQTREAFGLLEALGEDRVGESMLALSRRVREIAPDCLAMSMTLVQSGLTFTLAADSLRSALLDAVQYLDGGPCVDAVVHPGSDDPGVQSLDATDEQRWQVFARAGGHLGIAATLSLPVLEEEAVVAGINLYGATEHAFDGRHDELAVVCGAWAEGAVSNADMDFESRVRAAATPDRILDRRDVDLAASLVATVQGIDAYEAVVRMRGAAGRAGVTEGEFARFVLDVCDDAPPADRERTW